MHPLERLEGHSSIYFILYFLFIFCFIRVSYAGICLLVVKLLIVSKYWSQVGVPLKLAFLVYWGPDLSAPGVDHRLHLLLCRTESLEAGSEGWQ